MREIAATLIAENSYNFDYIKGVIDLAEAYTRFTTTTPKEANAPIKKTEEPAPTEGKKPKAKKQSKPKNNALDHGKIIACAKAGRSISWIADEMDAEYSTIWAIVNKWKKEQAEAEAEKCKQ